MTSECISKGDAPSTTGISYLPDPESPQPANPPGRLCIQPIAYFDFVLFLFFSLLISTYIPYLLRWKDRKEMRLSRTADMKPRHSSRTVHPKCRIRPVTPPWLPSSVEPRVQTPKLVHMSISFLYTMSVSVIQNMSTTSSTYVDTTSTLSMDGGPRTVHTYSMDIRKKIHTYR